MNTLVATTWKTFCKTKAYRGFFCHGKPPVLTSNENAHDPQTSILIMPATDQQTDLWAYTRSSYSL